LAQVPRSDRPARLPSPVRNMVHQAMDSYHIQFESGPTVVARKTFLDFDDTVEMPVIKRGSTAPAKVTCTDDDSDDEDDGDAQTEFSIEPAVEACNYEASVVDRDVGTGGKNEASTTQQALQGCDGKHSAAMEEALQEARRACRLRQALTGSNEGSIVQQALADNDALAPPPIPTGLCRHTTYDSFEQGEQCPASQGELGTNIEMMQPAGVVMLPVMASYTEMSAGMFPAAWMPLWPSSFSEAPQPMTLPVDSHNIADQPEEPQMAVVHPEQCQVLQQRAPLDAPDMKIAAERFDCGSPAVAPQPQTLAFSMDSGNYRTYWIVDARKLKANDKVAVSPAFEITCGSGTPITLKLMMYPKAVSKGKGCASFKNAKGRGFVQLKCESDVRNFMSGPLTFRLGISSGSAEGATQEAPRGPVTHDFADGVVCGLPKEEGEWDFSRVVDQASQTLAVFLEILPPGAT